MRKRNGNQKGEVEMDTMLKQAVTEMKARNMDRDAMEDVLIQALITGIERGAIDEADEDRGLELIAAELEQV